MAASAGAVLAGAVGIGMLARGRSNSIDKSFDESTKRHWGGYQATHIPAPDSPKQRAGSFSSSLSSSPPSSSPLPASPRAKTVFDSGTPQSHQMFYRGYRSSSFSEGTKK
eukprot:m.60478 g.60478  ORF g.60478 m.60478 type:complete len:110 (-) comp13095_c1_seq1:430-759(-)